MAMRLFIAGLVVLTAGSARAEHAHGMHHGDDAEHVFGAGIAMVAASFDTMLYGGNYQGLLPSLHWSRGRFAAGASTGLYRIEENGARIYGLGDVMFHGQVTLVGGHAARAGVVAMVSAPTGDDLHGLGMGHAMVMPAAFGMWTIERVALSASAGYSRAMGGDTDHDHGLWPIVDPMNMQELTWTTGGDVAITPKVSSGVRLAGGIPIGNGDQRLIGALRVGWASGRFATGAEVQAGFIGDPFHLRGVVSTALSF